MPWQDSNGSQHGSSPEWRGQPSSSSQWVEPPKPATPAIGNSYLGAPPTKGGYTPQSQYYQGAARPMTEAQKNFFKAIGILILVVMVVAMCWLGAFLGLEELDKRWKIKDASGPIVYSTNESVG